MRKVSLLGAPLVAAGMLAVGTLPAAAGPSKSDMQSARRDAQSEVNVAVKVARTMEKDPTLRNLVARAKGIFIATSFGRGGLIVGGRGGQGVLLVHQANGSWGEPVFYNFGGISIGAQAGGSGGEAAFVLMTPDAVDHFKSDNNFSLNAGSGLSVVNYSANAQASWGKGDVIFWTNTKGAYAGATVSASDFNWDSEETRAFYGKPNLTQDAVFKGRYNSPAGDKLQSVLPNNT